MSFENILNIKFKYFINGWVILNSKRAKRHHHGLFPQLPAALDLRNHEILQKADRCRRRWY